MRFIFFFISLTFAVMGKSQLPYIDIHKYQGPWYVIGYKPTFMDGNWRNTIETYTWNRQGVYDVLTTYKKKKDGPVKSIRQQLLPVVGSNNAQWIAKIWFFIRADYVIYKIADDYSWVVVGHPKQKYLYIMDRKPTMDPGLYAELVDYAVSLGYKREDIKLQPQD